MKIDHLFVFIQPDGPEIQALRSLGLRKTDQQRLWLPGCRLEDVASMA